MEPTRSLQHINTTGRTVVTRFGDLAAYREQIQIILFLLFIAGFLCLLNEGTKGLAMGAELGSALQSLLPLMVYSLSVLAAGFVLSWRRMSEQGEIKMIKMDDEGITLGTKKFDDPASRKITWQNIEAIEVVEEQTAKGAQRTFVYISTFDVSIFKLKWENAFAWEDSESFFVTLRKVAPHARINYAPGRIAQVNDDDSRYTNLWLQYFSSPGARERKGSLTPGTRLNNSRYTVLKRMGGGGQGTVYLATDKGVESYGDAPDYSGSTDYNAANLSADEYSKPPSMLHGKDQEKYGDLFAPQHFSQFASDDEGEKLVVLKEYILPVHRGAMLEEKHYELLNSEAEILSRINHPFIVKMLDCFVEDHRGYLVLEYVNGDSLRTLVERGGPLPEPVVKEAAINICDILSYLHEQFRPPVVHRDLTPDNLLVDGEGVIKLIDFTIARQFESQRTTQVAGKQSYISPEQFRGNPGPESDIYSLGCTMYFLLTGRDPEPMRQSFPAHEAPGISAGMNEVVASATALDTTRYQSAAQLKRALQQIG